MGETHFCSQLVKTGTALAQYCNAGTESMALDTLYHADCVSVEALAGPNGRQAKGLDAIQGKHDGWSSAFEIHESSAQGPFFHAPDQFSLIFHMDVTERESGQRTQSSEIGLYTVDGDGKVIREQFFYPPVSES